MRPRTRAPVTCSSTVERVKCKSMSRHRTTPRIVSAEIPPLRAYILSVDDDPRVSGRRWPIQSAKMQNGDPFGGQAQCTIWMIGPIGSRNRRRRSTLRAPECDGTSATAITRIEVAARRMFDFDRGSRRMSAHKFRIGQMVTYRPVQPGVDAPPHGAFMVTARLPEGTDGQFRQTA